MGKPRGIVWEHFTSVFIEGVEHGKCNQCSKNFKCKDGNTTGLRGHLKNRHPVIWKEILKHASEEKRQAIEALREIEGVYASDEEFDAQTPRQTFEVLGRQIKKPRLVRPESHQSTLK